MPRITFVQHDGVRKTIDAETGKSIMLAARDHDIPGVLGECGGNCVCSTCHCYVADEWISRLPVKRENEADLIDFAWEPRESSRLTCQIQVTSELDGLILHVPEQQL